jgi:hypothetical protein
MRKTWLDFSPSRSSETAYTARDLRPCCFGWVTEARREFNAKGALPSRCGALQFDALGCMTSRKFFFRKS